MVDCDFNVDNLGHRGIVARAITHIEPEHVAKVEAKQLRTMKAFIESN